MNDGAALLYLLLLGVMVGAALIARRPSVGFAVRGALIWAMLFAVAFGIFHLWQTPN